MFADLEQEILDSLPFFIIMNMVLVDCTEIKKRFLGILTGIRKSLAQSMHDNFKKTNSDITKRIDAIKEALKPRAETTAKLLEL
jgi:hypothetical protein